MINVSIVGFYGSGSSAVIDFLREFDNVGVALDKNEKGVMRPYEHFPFVSNGGLFECGALLTNVNSAYNSDKIINDFISCNERLNNNNFMSFGSYKWLVGDKFMNATNEFLSDIGAKVVSGGTSEHKTKIKFSLIMCALQLAALIVFKRPVYKWGKKNIFDRQPTYFAMPTKENYYVAAKTFINKYFDMCAQQGKDFMVYDQLICPQHTSIMEDYFDDNYKVITVERDARDIYSLSKYFWSKPPYGFSSPLTEDIDAFSEYWSKNVQYKKDVKNLLVIQFEDLVYNYEKTTKQIMNFLGIDEAQHVSKFKFFNPDLSIKNTQSFMINDKTKEEAEIIKQKLPQCIYDFPYENKTDYKQMFDDSKEVNDANIYKEKK